VASTQFNVVDSGTARAIAKGGAGGGNPNGTMGEGGDATASAVLTGNGRAQASAAGGAGATSGSATATATQLLVLSSQALALSAFSPAAAHASASASSAIGSDDARFGNLTPGVSASNATLSPSAPIGAVGGISAAYGGSGEQLEYTDTAFLQWDRASPGELVLNFLDDSGAGFDSLELDVQTSGRITTFTFDNLDEAQTFFGGTSLDLGPVGAGVTGLTLGFFLTMSSPGQGFGFDYDVAFESATATPEASTWAMMLLGFAGLGAATARRRRAAAKHRAGVVT
jgi:MYXO-CTERM domain-containing protein